MTTNEKTTTTNGDQGVITIPMLDELVHTDEHPICPDMTCPCKSDLQVGTKVLIEVEIRGFFEDAMMIAGGWMPLTRVVKIVE